MNQEFQQNPATFFHYTSYIEYSQEVKYGKIIKGDGHDQLRAFL